MNWKVFVKLTLYIVSRTWMLDEGHCPPGYQFKRANDDMMLFCLLYVYIGIRFDEVPSFPKVFGSIKIDRSLHVQQLQCTI